MLIRWSDWFVMGWAFKEKRVTMFQIVEGGGI